MMHFESVRYLDVYQELEKLARIHHGEVGAVGLSFNVDHGKLVREDRAGALVTVVAKEGVNKLIGYAIFVVQTSLQDRTALVASETAFFLHPDARRGRNALRFVQAAERIVSKHGIRKIVYHIDMRNDFSRLMHFLGYRDVERVVCKDMTGDEQCQ
ncbi:MAG: hypothetical protein HQL80_03540 [Magnetococcales bacterium]|nr:hypothetical protein [Magnetococcales bacterium]